MSVGVVVAPHQCGRGRIVKGPRACFTCQFFTVSTVSRVQYYLGATRGSNQNFYWTTGSKVAGKTDAEHDWNDYEPNDSNGIEDCITMWSSTTGWNDIRCDFMAKYVACERIP